MRLITCTIALLVAITAPSAHAQNPPQNPLLSDEHVQRVLMLALDNIQRGMCENLQPCAPTTDAEKRNPPITMAEARAVMHRGVLSGVAVHCDMDWAQRNFQPMMAHWRHTVKKSPRQMATIGMVHGIMQGMTGPQNSAEKKCDARLRQNLDLILTFKP
jgi:hypothetical protein